MTRTVVFVEPKLPPPTTSGEEGQLWSVDAATGACVWLRPDGRIECSPGRCAWSEPVAERFELAIHAARACAGKDWRSW